jgi:RNA polymerase sigma-70 factor (ECF subfamily)
MEDANGRSRLRELEKVITEFQDQLFRFAFFRTGCYADSQDIVQEVFIKLYNDNEHLASINNIRYYLFKSIANACIDYQRKIKRLKLDTLDGANIPHNLDEKDASHELILTEEYNRIEDLLSKLPAEQAETIRFRVLDDLSFTDIAEIKDLPVTTVKSRFKYGIDKLKSKVIRLKEVSYEL